MKTDEGVSAIQRARAQAMRERAHRCGASPLAAVARPTIVRLEGPGRTYIVDFLCVGAKLIVESDGAQHAENRRDETRDAYLARQGWTVLRFWNHEVMQNREGVPATILARAGLPW